MSTQVLFRIKEILAVTYAIFVVGATFSIALAQMALGVSVVLFLICAIGEGHNPFTGRLRFFYSLLAAYLGWLILSSLIGPTPGASLASIREEWLFVAIPAGVYLLRLERYRRRLMIAFGLAVGVISLYAIFQFATGIDLYHDSPLVTAGEFGWRPRGNFDHRLTFGNFYVTAGMVLLGYAGLKSRWFSSAWRHVLLTASALAAVAVALTVSRGVILSLVVALIVYSVTRGWRYLAMMIGILVVGLTLLATSLPILVERFDEATQKETDAGYEGGRLFIWRNSLAIVGDHPVVGVGPGNFRTEYEKHLRADIEDRRKHSHAHNDVLNVAANAGIPAALLYAGLWLAAFGYFWRGWRGGLGSKEAKAFSMAALLGSLAFGLTSLTEATFADEEVRQLLMFAWAVGLWPWYETQTGGSGDAIKSA